jgi:peptidoglycan hydrolase-like protein with peptidoglycan-binding domain
VRLRGEFQKLQAGVLPNLDIRAAQLFLTFHGLHPGPIDGFVGPLTRAAIAEFQMKNGMNQTGLVDDDLLERLLQ